jgi:hypothetical protein
VPLQHKGAAAEGRQGLAEQQTACAGSYGNTGLELEILPEASSSAMDGTLGDGAEGLRLSAHRAVSLPSRV